MAWRLHDHVIRAELDFTQRGRITGQIWLLGFETPVTLDLTGMPWRDLAGHRLTLVNPRPRGEALAEGFSPQQIGLAGDITASRKCRIPDCTEDELTTHLRNRTPFPWHWGNTLYLEWFSQINGRVVIEAADYELNLDALATWSMDEAEEAAHKAANQDAISTFFEALNGDIVEAFLNDFPEEEDGPTSAIEAEADAEAARMNLLLDRVTARLQKENLLGSGAFERVLAEERERLRRELGEPDPEPLTPEQEAEQARWIEAMNAAADEALEELANHPDALEEDEDHPTQKACFDLSLRLHREIKNAGWLDDHSPREHPLHELVCSLQIASAKLAGALNGTTRRGEWPPDPLFAGDTLVRLKKARHELRNARTNLRAAHEDALATRPWLTTAEHEVAAILKEVENLIAEVRSSLE